MDAKLICLYDDAFYTLLDELVERIKEKEKIKEDKWISPEEAMHKLRIKSTTTLQRMRDEGLIRYSQPFPKLIVYDTDSIDAFLEKHAKNTF